MAPRAAAATALLFIAGCGATPSSLPSHVPPRVAGATAIGPVDADEPIRFVLGMKLRDRARLEALLAAGAILTPEAFADAFAPSAAEYADVVAALRARGLEVTESPTRTTVTAAGRAADVAVALGTTILRYIDLEGEFRAPGSLALAAETEALVDGVAGLDDAGRWWSQRVPVPPTPVPEGASGSIEPADLKMMYDLAGAGLGDGETIAILGTGLPPSTGDIDGWVTKFSLPVDRQKQYAQIFVGGPNRDPDGLVQNEYYENVLDADMALAVAPHANVVHVLTATNSPGLFSDGIMVANGADQVLYLVNPSPPMPDAQGRDRPASGELHLAICSRSRGPSCTRRRSSSPSPTGCRTRRSRRKPSSRRAGATSSPASCRSRWPCRRICTSSRWAPGVTSPR